MKLITKNHITTEKRYYDNTEAIMRIGNHKYEVILTTGRTTVELPWEIYEVTEG